MKNIFIWLFLWLEMLFAFTAFAHPCWQQHAVDQYGVLGLAEDDRLTQWLRQLNSNVIDNPNYDKKFYEFVDGDWKKIGFYDHLKLHFPDFKCQHRFLFHWGYNSNPWTEGLERKVKGYGWDDRLILAFKDSLRAEQKRRNAVMNRKTEDLFGYGHQGKEAQTARILVSLAYDVHVVGDYTTDNKSLGGMMSLKAAVGDIVNNLRSLDLQVSAPLLKRLRKFNGKTDDVQASADSLLDLLVKEVPVIIRSARGGEVKRHLESMGFAFISSPVEYSFLPGGCCNPEESDKRKNEYYRRRGK